MFQQTDSACMPRHPDAMKSMIQLVDWSHPAVCMQAIALERLVGERVTAQQQLKTLKAEQAVKKGVANLQRDGMAGDAFAAAVKVVTRWPCCLFRQTCLLSSRPGGQQHICTQSTCMPQSPCQLQHIYLLSMYMPQP